MSIEAYRLSPQQLRLWRLHGKHQTLRVQALMRLEGAPQSGPLEHAVARLVARHEPLRTRFPSLPGLDAPVQEVMASGEVEWDRVDFRTFPAATREERALAHFQQVGQRPFELGTGPVLRVSLMTLDTGQHLLGLVAPALCADAATLRRVCSELQRDIAGQAQESEQDGEPASHLSFSEWQNELREELTERDHPAATFWEKHGTTAGAAVTLPFEGPANAAQTFDPASLELTLNGERLSRLDAAARELGCSLQGLLLATWSAELWKLTGQTDLVLGLQSDGREHEELAEVVGPLSRWVPLRVRLDAAQPLSELALQLQQAQREALEWQRYYVWPAADGERVPGRDFPAIGFRWEDLPATPHEGAGVLRLESTRAYVDQSKLSLCCVRTRSTLTLELQYDRSRFPPASAEQVIGQLETLLEQIAGSPRARLDVLDAVSPRERARLLVDFNATAREYPARCVHTWMEEQASRHPDRVALVYEERTLTYAQLDAWANRVAHALRRRGVGPEMRVGLYLNRSLEIMVGILAVLKSGAAYVPLDPGQPRQRLAGLLDDIQAKVLLTQSRLRETVPEAEGREVLCLDEEATFAGEPTRAPPCGALPEHPAYVLFTSGSTGRPKGVVVEHRQLHNYVASVMERLDLPEGAAYATVSTFSADLGNTVIFPALCLGGTLHVISAERVSDPAAFVEYLQRNPIDVLKIVPSHLRALASAGTAGALLPRQRLILGGEATPRAWAEELQAQAPGCRIYNHYGPTETTVGVMTFHLDPSRPLAALSTLPLERPIDNTQVYVLDARLRPVAVGMTGELYVGGAALARGYLNRPDLTAQSFLPNPFSATPSARMYRTGDLARHLPDGTLEHLGRADNQVKYHGYRIELNELRHALNQHPQVRDSVMMLKRDTNGNEVLVAYYVSRQEQEHAQLRAFLAERLIEEVLPNVYVHLKKLPLTLNGKVNHEALPSLEEARRRQRSQLVAPRTPVEATLADIWCQVLNLKEVSVTDNFFSVGGDSILGILVVSKADQAGLKLTPRQLFKHQTIAELASVAAQAPAAPDDEGPVSGPLPLTQIQRWFLEQEVPDLDGWGIVVPLEARQPLDPSRLQQALTALLNHHDVLRLRVTRNGSGWEALMAPPGAPMPFTRFDLASVPDASLEERFQALGHELQAKLRLDGGPVVVTALLELGPHRPSRLMIAAHRLVVDGVSWRVLFEQLQLAYEQLGGGGECKLPPRTTSVRSWLERLQGYADSPRLREELAHWTAQEKEQPRPLPVERPGPLVPTSLERELTHALSSEESRLLLNELPEAYRCEIGELLIATLAWTLHEWTGHPEVLLDIEGHGREDVFDDVDLSRTVGWLTSLYPVRLTPEPVGPSATVRTVKEQLRSVPNRGLGYGVLRYLSPDAELRARLARAPQAEVLFRYVGQYHLAGPWFTVLDHPEQRAPTRQHKLAVIARVADGQLHVTWYFSTDMHETATVERLSARYLDTLRTLLAKRGAPEQQVLAPSDFPLAGLDQSKLDKLLGKLKK
ncbi:hypothetical protein BHS06_21560 [Myxococcus xanthus]|uniref:non-ribosomal peptide synthetase n=1 Tax=Myxococcus xanthus TaxID=34 RepID=UPI00116229E9|nr:non-ribosomal peptide synthetase [Myxococcus xanthus]QDE91358.1 hypothetical protein BHS06_21560 [Myxococcus xanthus]